MRNTKLWNFINALELLLELEYCTILRIGLIYIFPQNGLKKVNTIQVKVPIKNVC